MSAPHRWAYDVDGDKYDCSACGAVYGGLQETCPAAEPTLRQRIEQLAVDARSLSLDLRASRDAAPAGEKAAFRYPLRHIEHAVALLERASK